MAAKNVTPMSAMPPSKTSFVFMEASCTADMMPLANTRAHTRPATVTAPPAASAGPKPPSLRAPRWNQ